MPRTQPFDEYLDEYEEWFQQNGFGEIEVVQTVFGDLRSIRQIQLFKEGYGDGGFVVIKAKSEVAFCNNTDS